MVKNFKTGGDERKVKVETLKSELSLMKKEIEDMKEILRGLIQVVMSRDGPLDEDEYN
ncbi:MAG: hypothetical protein AAE986_01570 [Thermoplasmataceae archaeon]|jgi:hypothetical protein